MSNSQFGAGRHCLRAVLAGVCVTGLLLQSAAASPKAAPAKNVRVFVHPEKLTAEDRLVDGGSGNEIEITGETTLIWVDLMPGARFAHPTEYILISAEGTRVVKGNWWPELNGKALFRDGKTQEIDSSRPVRDKAPVRCP